MLAELQALQLMPTAAQPQPRPMTYDDLAKLTHTCNAIKVSHYAPRIRFISSCKTVNAARQVLQIYG